ncbi:hypothetical protein BOO71_0013765 [Deinococcus marmoris]|uniref:Uncharacterized protein n=1 Tax=Deinococcus marmoris TaxID=249408 RepID=A0A1U7NSC4_9DEIO|nr:hypothetical protein BOO71_0013765 [Deinococcus marmoris]
MVCGLNVGGAILYITSSEDLMATIKLDTAALMRSDDVTP